MLVGQMSSLVYFIVYAGKYYFKEFFQEAHLSRLASVRMVLGVSLVESKMDMFLKRKYHCEFTELNVTQELCHPLLRIESFMNKYCRETKGPIFIRLNYILDTKVKENNLLKINQCIHLELVQNL